MKSLPRISLLGAYLTLSLLSCFSTKAEELVLFDTSEIYDDNELRPGFEIWAADEAITQPFYTGDSDAIVSVELDVRIFQGSPSGRLMIEVWSDDGDGKPSEKVGTLGSVELAEIPDGDKRPVVHTTVEGRVSGLKPQSHYHVIMNHAEVAFRPPLERDKLWYSTYGSDPESSGAGRAAASGEFTGNNWKTLEQILIDEGNGGAADRRFLVMQIVGARTAPVPSYTLTAPSVPGGTVSVSPKQDTYSAGTEVTLTVTPNDGYAFTKWLIGEEEFTENPLTFTISGDKDVTAMFNKLTAPWITDLTIDPTTRDVSLTWQSQVNVTYEVEMSTDLLGWESLGSKQGAGALTTAMVDNVPRNARQRFYRLRQKP